MNFDKYFAGTVPVAHSAPGRVNLLGEHTDYNDGFVLPIATPMRTTVFVAPSKDDAFHLYSEQLDEHVLLSRRGHIGSGFGRYMEGCIRLLEAAGHTVPPLRLYVRSDVPVGAGLSSSAALEVATLRALRAQLSLTLDDIALARMAQKAEITFAGVECGIMDQMASSLCDAEHMLFLDTRSLESEVLPLPRDSEVLVIDSGVARTLAATKYNERRAECSTAAHALGLTSLRELTEPSQLERVDQPYRRRAQHVWSENARTRRAAGNCSAAQFGILMNESHESLRDDYEVSIAELDILCDLMRSTPGVYGARLTGAGFGGACVALCEAGTAASAGQAVIARYNTRGRSGRVLMPQPQNQG